GVGREVKRYLGFDLAETSYVDAGSVSGDTLLEQTEQAYDAAGNLIQTTVRQRYHSATGTGELGSPSSTQPKARVTYSASWHDGMGRVVAMADYGTNGGTALVRPSTIPARSDTVLVTSTQFNSAGDVQTTTDPKGTVSCFEYDAVGREVKRI